MSLWRDLLVCVGGEADGRRVGICLGQTCIMVPHINSLPVADDHEILPVSVEVHYTLYDRSPWPSGDSTRYVLTPRGQRPEETLALLLDGYAPRKEYGL